jgi:hypothetical protein
VFVFDRRLRVQLEQRPDAIDARELQVHSADGEDWVASGEPLLRALEAAVGVLAPSANQ